MAVRPHPPAEGGVEVDPRSNNDATTVHRVAVDSLFSLFDSLCEGAVAVDRDARIVWINDKYRALLGLGDDSQVIGQDIRKLLPHTLMHEVVESGQPILLDVMQFKERYFVVTRLPLFDSSGEVTGGIGFVLYDKLDYLKPLVTKFEDLRRELDTVRRELSAQRQARYSVSQYAGSSPAAMAIKRLARRAAQLDATILLVGETGTGKELLAQGIHSASARAGGPFVGVNVAAVPETLLEAEFFGVAPGAYTGAERRGREGKFQVADGGTLFLDEVGDMPLNLQAKLLRVLQEQEIEPLGSNRVIRVDTRIIAATSCDLKQLVDEGRFRDDLYFRLNVLPINVPALRERLDDLEVLCEIILEQIAARAGLPQRQLDNSALDALAAHHWPGNVRELQNVLEQACLLTDGPNLSGDHFTSLLPPEMLARGGRHRLTSGIRPLPEAIEDLERASIRAALDAADGKRSAAAKLLRISRSSLYQKLTRYKLLYDK